MSESDIFLTEETYDKEQYIYDPSFELGKGKEAGKSLILSFISQLKPGMDISRIQAPLFLLDPISFLEASADYVKPTNDLVKISAVSDSLQRIKNIAKWLLTNLSLPPQKGFSRMKPYNPILGEQFYCSWDHEDSTTQYVSEQVSHHPPISSLVMENRKYNWLYTSTTAPKSTFLGNKAETRVDGVHKLYLLETGEVYTIEWPVIVARGIIFGTSLVEITEAMTVTSNKSDIVLKVDYKKKKNNEIAGSISYKGQVVEKLSGNLKSAMYTTNQKGEKNLLLDASKVKHLIKRVVPVSKQKKNESRRVWHPVTFNLLKNDFDTAGQFKHLIEERQRRIAKERKENGGEIDCADFKKTDKTLKSGEPLYEYKRLNLKPTKEESGEEEELDLD